MLRKFIRIGQGLRAIWDNLKTIRPPFIIIMRRLTRHVSVIRMTNRRRNQSRPGVGRSEIKFSRGELYGPFATAKGQQVIDKRHVNVSSSQKSEKSTVQHINFAQLEISN